VLLLRCSLVSSSFGRISENNTTDTFFKKAAVFERVFENITYLTVASFERVGTTTALLDCNTFCARVRIVVPENQPL
jgi:hypothetical protein